jgi:hypothetical protein
MVKEKGELAQLVERLHGMQEVTGSNPVFSTKTLLAKNKSKNASMLNQIIRP